MGQVDLKQPTEDARTRVFLSYSRRDAGLVGRVAEGLLAAGYLPDYDQAAHDPGNVSAGISAEDEWWKRLQEMIAAADVMVFLVSPDSAESKVCDEEIAYARALGKRIIAVLARTVDFAKAPPRLAALNVRIDFSESGPGFDEASAALASALELNVGWHRDGRKYLARVQEWDTEGRPRSQLLREGAVEEAERWAVARPRNEPEPGELFLAWIAASRAQIKADAARRAFWRRVTAIFVLTTLVATLAGAWFVVNGQRNLGRSESLMLARTADQFYNQGDYLRALHLAILASRNSFLSPSTHEAKAAFSRSAQALTHEASARLPLADGVFLQAASLSPDGTEIAAWDSAGAIYLWEIGTSEPVRVLQHGLGEPVVLAWFEPEADRLVAWNREGLSLWSLTDGKQVGAMLTHPHEGEVAAIWSAAPVAGGRQLITTGSDGNPRIWNLADGTLARVLDLGTPGITRLNVSEEAGLIFGIGASSIDVWDASDFAAVRTPLEFESEIKGVVVSPDGFQLAVWEKSGRLSLHDLVDETTRTLQGCHSAASGQAQNGGEVQLAKFVPATDRIITASDDLIVCVWSTLTGEQIGMPLPLNGASEGSFDVSSDGELLATWSFLAGARLTSLRTGELVNEMPLGVSVESIRFAPDGWDMLVKSGSAAYLVSAGSFTLEGGLISEGDVQHAEYTADGRHVLAFESGGVARLYSTEIGGSPSPKLPHTHFFFGPYETRDGQGLLTLDGNDLRLWRVDGYLSDPPQTRRAVLSPDGRRLFRVNEDDIGELVDTETGQQIAGDILTGGDSAVFDASQPQMALVFEGAVQLINSDTGATRDGLMESEQDVASAAFMLGGRRLVTADESGSVILWNTETMGQIGAVFGHDDARDRISASASGVPPSSSSSKRMVVWTGDTARLIDLETGKPVGSDLVHAASGPDAEAMAAVNGAAFASGGGVLVTWNSVEARLWRVSDASPMGEPIRPEGGVSGAALSADGGAVLVFGGPQGRVWDTGTMTPKDWSVRHERLIEGGLFSGNGTTLFTWGEDAVELSGRLWNAETGRAIGEPISLPLETQAVSFVAGDRRLWWRDAIGTHVFADTATGEVVGREKIGTYLTDAVLLEEPGRVQTVQIGTPQSAWDVRFALSLDATAKDIASACELKLKGPPDAGGAAAVRRLDSASVIAAPILRGREEEDVCTPPKVAWWESAAGFVFGWAFD